MTPYFPFGETVVLHTRSVTGQDADGNDIPGDTTTTLENVPVWPSDGNGTSGNEQTQGRDTVIQGYSALLPPGTVVSAVDKVTVYGKDFEVNGLPGFFRSPFTGTDPGIVVNLTRVTG